MKLFSLISLFSLASLAYCETHYWNFTAEWVDANPDGGFERQAIGLNGEWPLPVLRVNKNDRVILNLTNGLPDQNTSLHFHGLFQPGSNQMDGPEMITQCPIPPGSSFLYNFTVGDQVGTYWYHSHTHGQTGDGFRGVFIIDDEDIPFEYDEEVVITVSEWYHQYSDELTANFLNLYNPTGAEPIPSNVLMNETTNFTWNVQPDTTYFVRFVNIGGFVSQYIYMEDHEFEVVEVDGVWVEPNVTDTLYITVAQRYGVLIRTKNTTDQNFAFMHGFDPDMLDVIPPELQLNQTGTIVYDESNDNPGEYFVNDYNFLDDFYLQPIELLNNTLYDEPDVVVTVDVTMNNLNDGKNYAFFNNLTYTYPKVPTLHTVLSAGEDAGNAEVYGSNTHSIVLEKDEIVDIVLNNQDPGKHPFHLHGHLFQLISRGDEVGEFDTPVPFSYDDHSEFPENPVLRDTVYVRPNSYIVMRFKADHPGVWFFHCHIEWHLIQGLALQFIEDPQAIVADAEQQLTQNHIDVCEAAGVPWRGNAAGNDDDFFDLTNENVQTVPLPAGFTARGIVALVFSCIAGVLGLVTIAIYGMADIKNIESNVVRDLDVDIRDDDEITADSSSAIENSSTTNRQ